MTLRQQLMGTQQRQHDQAQGGCQVGDQQQPQNHARAFAQSIAEGLGSRRHAFVDGRDMGLPLPHIVRVDLIGPDCAVHLAGQLIQLNQVAIPYCPQFDGFFQVAEMSEVEVQPDQAVNVIRMVAALENAQTCGLQVWRGAVQGNAQFVPALRHGDGLLVFEVGGLVAVVGIERQIIDGVLLALGP